MGEAKRRGTFEQRKAQAIAQGRGEVCMYRQFVQTVAMALEALAMPDRQNTGLSGGTPSAAAAGSGGDHA